MIQQPSAALDYERHGNQFVADFIGTTNFLPATVKGPDMAPGFYRVTSEVGELKARAVETLREGAKIVLSVRPEDIQLSESRPHGENVLEGIVDTKVFLGESVDSSEAEAQNAHLAAHPSIETQVGERSTASTRKMRSAKRGMTVKRWASDVIVDLLQAFELPYAALNPGASYRGLHDSIVNYGANKPCMMLCQHEETAVQIAHGYAKASGKPMVAILHNLVGLLHANMAVYYAYADRRPVSSSGHRSMMRPSAARASTDPRRAGARRGIRAYTNGITSRRSSVAVPSLLRVLISVMRLRAARADLL